MNEKVAKLINEQITHEFYSAYLYLDFANYYGAVGLDGFENWYKVQAQEEADHAMLFYQYLQNNGEKVTFGVINKPDKVLADNMAPLKARIGAREYVTGLISAICRGISAMISARCSCSTGSSRNRARRKTTHQDMITKMELFGSDAKGLYMLNSELKTRVYNPPSLTL